MTNASINSSGAHSPRGKLGAFAHVVSPGGGAFAILSRPRGLGISIPKADPGHLTHVFSKDISVYREGRGLCQRLACPSGTRKTCQCFLKVCFLNFRYVFTTCKHINISDKVNYILFNTKQSLR